MWKQWLFISFYMLIVVSFGFNRMYHFSSRHKQNTPVIGENVCARSKIVHLISKSYPSSFSVQIFWLSVVSLPYLLWLNDFLWFANLSYIYGINQNKQSIKKHPQKLVSGHFFLHILIEHVVKASYQFRKKYFFSKPMTKNEFLGVFFEGSQTFF